MNLGGVIGELLAIAVGVAISPIPIIAVVLMLLSAHATRIAPAFAAGWVVGLLVAGVIVLLVASPADVSSGGSGETGSGWLDVALGVLFLALARRRWRHRSDSGEEALPRWLTTLDRMTPGRSFALGFGLAAVNPKNLALTIAAALAISRADLSTGRSAVALLVFVAIASLTVAGPVLALAVMRERAQPPLLRFKDWLVRENDTVMIVLLVVLGALLLGKGLGVISV